MESQSESDVRSRTGQTENASREDADRRPAGPDVEARKLLPKPMDPDDPLRASRLAKATEQTNQFLQSVGLKGLRSERLDEGSERQLYRDAAEREKWSQTAQDVYSGLLRLGVKTPPRSTRVL